MALTVSLVIAAGSVYAYRQHMHAVRITQAKIMLEGLRQGIEMHRYRKGRFPTVDELKNNSDEDGRPFFGPASSKLRDPIHPPQNASDGSPINPPSGWGGWIYNPVTGVIQPNLDPADYPADPPSRW